MDASLIPMKADLLCSPRDPAIGRDCVSGRAVGGPWEALGKALGRSACDEDKCKQRITAHPSGAGKPHHASREGDSDSSGCSEKEVYDIAVLSGCLVTARWSDAEQCYQILRAALESCQTRRSL